ncbi:MAG: hypothetical protein ACOY3L_14390 [Pseudomonadota bacterium]
MRFAKISALAVCLIATSPTLARAQADDLTREQRDGLQRIYDSIGGNAKFDEIRQAINFVLMYGSNLHLAESGGLSAADQEKIRNSLKAQSKLYAQSVETVLDSADKYSGAVTQHTVFFAMASGQKEDSLATAQERLLLQHYGVPAEQLDRLMSGTPEKTRRILKRDSTSWDGRRALLRSRSKRFRRWEIKGAVSANTALKVAAAAAGLAAGLFDIGVAIGALPVPGLIVPASALVGTSSYICGKLWEAALEG